MASGDSIVEGTAAHVIVTEIIQNILRSFLEARHSDHEVCHVDISAIKLSRTENASVIQSDDKTTYKCVRFSSPISNILEYINNGESDSDGSTIDLDDEFYDTLTDDDVSMYAPIFQKNLPFPQLKRSLGFYNRNGPEHKFEESNKLSHDNSVKNPVQESNPDLGYSSIANRPEQETCLSESDIEINENNTMDLPDLNTVTDDPICRVEENLEAQDHMTGSVVEPTVLPTDVAPNENRSQTNIDTSPCDVHSLIDQSEFPDVPLIQVQPPSPCCQRESEELVENMNEVMSPSIENGNLEETSSSSHLVDSEKESQEKGTQNNMDEVLSENDNNNNSDDETHQKIDVESDRCIGRLNSTTFKHADIIDTSDTEKDAISVPFSKTNVESSCTSSENGEEENKENQTPMQNTMRFEYKIPTLIVQPPSQEEPMKEDQPPDTSSHGTADENIPTIIVQPPSPLRSKPVEVALSSQCDDKENVPNVQSIKSDPIGCSDSLPSDIQEEAFRNDIHILKDNSLNKDVEMSGDNGQSQRDSTIHKGSLKRLHEPIIETDCQEKYMAHSCAPYRFTEDLDTTISETITNLLDTVCLSDENIEHLSYKNNICVHTPNIVSQSDLQESFMKQELYRNSQDTSQNCFISASQLFHSQHSQEYIVDMPDTAFKERCPTDAPVPCATETSVTCPKDSPVLSAASQDQCRSAKRRHEDGDIIVNKIQKILISDQIVPTHDTHQTYPKEVPSFFTTEDPKVYSCDVDLCDPRGDTTCQTVDHFRLSQGHCVAQSQDDITKTTSIRTSTEEPNIQTLSQSHTHDVPVSKTATAQIHEEEHEEHTVPKAAALAASTVTPLPSLPASSFQGWHFHPPALPNENVDEARVQGVPMAQINDRKALAAASAYCAPPPCKRPRRIGLSRRQRVAPLHAVFRSPEA